MKTIKIDGKKLMNWKGFHSYFKKCFGFPSFYGNNMNAWIDCMTCLDEPESGMSTKLYVAKGERISLHILHSEQLKEEAPEIYTAIVECSSFVNARRIEKGDNPLIILSF